MTNEEAIKFLKQIYPNGGGTWLDNQRIEAIRMAINALQRESVSEDLEEEIQRHLEGCLDVKFPTTDVELIKKDVAYTARKFFKLGLKVNNNTPNILITSIDDILEKYGVNPYSKEAKTFKECYYVAMEKLIARKGE